jgi:hypothetical protein
MNAVEENSIIISNSSADMFDSLNDSEENDDHNESFELENAIDDECFVLCNKRIDYQLRPTELDDVCLYTFYSEYRKMKMRTVDKKSFEHICTSRSSGRRGRPQNDRWLLQTNHPQYSSHMIIRRSFSVVPVLIGPPIPRRERDDTIERYARAILTLFHPWRGIQNICQSSGSWNDTLKIHEKTFTSASKRIINNIQLLHECKRDRDSDLFQLVNEPLPSRSINTSTPFSDENVEDAEEILSLLDNSFHLYSSLSNEETNECEGVRARIKREYLKLTLASVIRSERFSCITDMTGLNEFVLKSSDGQSNIKIGNDDLIRIANQNDFQEIRQWQYNLKTQKEYMRRILLYGSEDKSTPVKMLNILSIYLFFTKILHRLII